LSKGAPHAAFACGVLVLLNHKLCPRQVFRLLLSARCSPFSFLLITDS